MNEVKSRTFAWRVLQGLKIAFGAVFILSMVVFVRNIYDGRLDTIIAIKSLVKSVAWVVGACLWCTGRESAEGILHIFVGSLGFFFGITLPLLLSLSCAKLQKRLDRNGARPLPESEKGSAGSRPVIRSDVDHAPPANAGNSGGSKRSVRFAMLRYWPVVVLIVVVVSAWGFRYEWTPAGNGAAFRTNRWTGQTSLIVGDKEIPVTLKTTENAPADQ